MASCLPLYKGGVMLRQCVTESDTEMITRIPEIPNSAFADFAFAIRFWKNLTFQTVFTWIYFIKNLLLFKMSIDKFGESIYNEHVRLSLCISAQTLNFAGGNS